MPAPDYLTSVENRPWLWQRPYTTVEVQLLGVSSRDLTTVPSTGARTGSSAFGLLSSCARMPAVTRASPGWH